MDRTEIARVAHEINRAYCASLGDTSQPSWDNAPEWQKTSALAGVDMHLANPDATPEDSHESWLAQKTAEGWKYGPVKDAQKKEHPCFLPYAELPPEQKAKDYLFRAVVHALKNVKPLQAAPAPRLASIAERPFTQLEEIERMVQGAMTFFDDPEKLVGGEEVILRSEVLRLMGIAEDYFRRISETLSSVEVAWSPMSTAPKDGSAILALLEGSDIPLAIRWRDEGWEVTWDGHRLSEHDGPISWMKVPGDLRECREILRLAGKPYPKSSCPRCGTLIRPGWKCAIGVGG